MDWLSVPKGFLGAKKYSAHFNYPLSPYEIWFWQVGTNLPKPKTNKNIIRPRQKTSLQKLIYLDSKLPLLTRNPFILAIFITGSLAMNNSVPNDDIDLMFISLPYTLWLCRLWNILVLSRHKLRRPPYLPEHSSFQVSNKFCDNLYLEDLYISTQNLYTAHEVLQAKPIYDPFGIHRQFLLQNSWTKTYLPVASRETLKKSSFSKPLPKTGLLDYWILGLLNLFAFITQYLYMLPKVTNESIGLRQAFFHPRPTVV